MTQQQPIDELTPAEVQQIFSELQEWVSRLPHPEEWQLYCFSHLHDMPMETYLVTFKDGYAQVYFRHENGRLEPAESLAYYPPKKEGE